VRSEQLPREISTLLLSTATVRATRRAGCTTLANKGCDKLSVQKLHELLYEATSPEEEEEEEEEDEPKTQTRGQLTR